MSEYPKRHWGLRGGPDSGKSTFLSANAERPLYVIDADGRFDFVRGLSKGDVIYPDTNKGSILPADIQEQATSNVLFSEADVKSIGVDSVTQIFIYQSRLASIRGNMSAAERKERGLGTNKASDMVDKSNAMAVLRTLAGFRTAVYYIWHTTEGRDHRGVEETRDVISKVELKRLFSTMAVILDFAKENGRYQVTVTWARGIDDRPANTGFTLTDTPNNFWRGGALRLERAMYTTFNTEGEAIDWAMEKLGKGDYGEVEQHWQDVTRKYRDWPIKAAMWVDDIYSRVGGLVKTYRIVGTGKRKSDGHYLNNVFVDDVCRLFDVDISVARHFVYADIEPGDMFCAEGEGVNGIGFWGLVGHVANIVGSVPRSLIADYERELLDRARKLSK